MSESATSASGAYSGVPPIVSYGLVSGINTAQIIQAELQPFEIPLNNLEGEQSTLQSNISDYQQINTDVLALKAAAMNLAMPSGWTARSATSSNTSVATASAGPGTPAGTLQFTVTQLAAANSLVSTGSVSSTSQVVTSSPDLLLSMASQLGFSSLASTSGVSLGAHTFSVSQSSQAASATGTVALGSQSSGINITTGSNDTLNVTADGNSYTLTIAASPPGGYSGAGLLSAVQTAISSAGASGVIQAGYDSSGHLILSTVDQGSSQTLSVTGGDAMATLGLSSSSSTGADAIVSVDGTSNTISTVVPGGAVTLSGPSGATYSAVLAGTSSQQYANSSLINAGSVTATDVSSGSGSLSDVVAAINSSGTGIVASAVATGSNQYVLQLSSPKTGTNGDLTIAGSAFSSSSLGTLKTASAGQNAQLQIGGAGGYTVSSQNDTFTGLLPGLTVNAQQVSATPVTVTVANDANAIASSVSNMVDDANTVLSDLQKYAGYNEQTKVGGPLMGSASLQDLLNQILSTFASAAGTSGLGSADNVGISISNGQITFNQSQFEAAYQANPSQVQSLFTQGGTFAPSSSPYTGEVSLSYASNGTRSGTYDVQISQSAAQATSTGSVLSSGTVGAAETLTIGSGSASATYTTSAGQSLSAVVSGLNAAFAAQGMSLSAEVINGDQVKIVSAAYGSASQFTVSTTNTGSGTLGLTGGSSSATFAGTDVEGTINGVAATGSGQFLTAPTTDTTLAGLSLQVTASGISSTTDLGQFTYTPGLAQALSNVAYDAADPTIGSITQTVQGLQTQIQGITPQITMYNSLVQEEQKLLMAKYATMESELGSLKNQSSALAGELAQISANGH